HVVAFVVDCPHETSLYNDDGDFLVIRTADVESGHVDDSAMRRVTDSEYQKRVRRATLKRGDIVYSREGERGGHAAVIPVDNRYCLGQRMIQLRSDDRTNASYLHWLMNADSTYQQGSLDTVG